MSQNSTTTLTYAAMTPAKNEAGFIEKTILSMIGQTHKPERWIIVNDGSTDATGEIIERYARQYDWIRQLVLPLREEYRFDAKVNALKKGYEMIADYKFDAIAFLDADITFDESHFAFLCEKIIADDSYGIIGVPFQEGDYNSYYSTSRDINHVSGACQFFRRACYEDVGGYTPMKLGGEDRVAVLTAQMKGWTTRTFPERHVIHNRVMGQNAGNIMKIRFKQGVNDYMLWNHPLWQAFRFVFQLFRKPFLTGAFAILFGFLSGYVKRLERPVSPELIRYIRAKQMEKLGKRMGKP